MTPLLAAAVVVALTWAFLAVFAWLYAGRVVFQPQRSSYRDGPRILKVRADDGTLLSVVHLPAPGARWTFYFLHGNGEDLGDILWWLEDMRAHGYSAYAIDYRGYGTTPGAPTEANVLADAHAGFRHLCDQLGVSARDIVIYGRSMGSGPAVDVALREPVAGLILDGGFVSAFRVVTVVPVVPGDHFDNYKKLPRVQCPVLVIHGKQDRTIPFRNGPSLLARVRSRKQHLWVENADHNDLVKQAGHAYWHSLEEFTKSLD